MATKNYIGPNRLSEIFSYIKAELDKKVTAVSGKGLSSNDYTTTEKNKLAGISSGAEVNVQSDWTETNTSSDAFILHKPTKLSQFTNDIVTDNNPSLSWATKSKVATIGGIDINVTMPANPNTDTTYTLATGDANGQIKVTPSSGSAYNVSVKGLGDRAFDSTSYLPLTGGVLNNSSSDTPLYVKGNSVGAYIGFQSNSGSNLGYYGVKNDNLPYFFSGSSKRIALLSDVPDISTKVSKSGDTMSGNLTFSGSAGIQYQGTKSTYKMISFKDNTSDTYGNGIVIGGGGLTIIGGGESASTVASQYSTGGSEDMVVAGDGNIYLLSNVNNGYSERKTFTFSTSGDLTVPRYVYANYFNSSAAAETPSADSYLIYSNSDGWYRKSTIENIEAINGNYTAWIPVTTSPSAGWRRICKITYGKKGYENGFLLISGGWNNGAPSSAIISICVRHTVASMLLLQNIATDGMIQQVRMVNVSGSTYWIDAYMKAQSNGVSEQYFKFYGNFEISEIQKSATIITDSVTAAASVNLTTSAVSGTVITSNSIGSQSVSYATSAGSATDSTKLPLAGGTMTGQIKTSFKTSIAMGSFAAASTTIPTLCDELRYSSGCCGSASLTAYTGSPSSVAAGWYNFLWIPHRSGGVNGAASGDNCNYGRLMLRGMTVNGEYEIRYASSGIQYCRELISAANIGSQSVNYATSAGTATKATQDGSGNTITSTYFKLSGGTITGATIVNAATTVNAAITFGKSDSYGIFPSTHNYCSIGSENYCFFQAYVNNLYLGKSSNYTGSIYFKHTNSSKKTQIAPQAETNDSTLWLPIGGGTFATQEWVKTKNVYCTDSGSDGSNFVCYIENGLYHILVAQGFSSAVSTAYGSWFYTSKTITIPTTVQTFIGSKTKFAFAGSAVNSGSGLHTVSIQGVSKTSISYYLCSARSESAKQYYVYFHYYYIP